MNNALRRDDFPFWPLLRFWCVLQVGVEYFKRSTTLTLYVVILVVVTVVVRLVPSTCPRRAPKVDRVCFFGAPRAIRICPVMIITFVRIMQGQDNPVGTMQAVSIVLPIIGARMLMIMGLWVGMMTIPNCGYVKSGNLLFEIFCSFDNSNSSAPVQCKSY